MSMDPRKWDTAIAACRKIIRAGDPLDLQAYRFLVSVAGARIKDGQRGPVVYSLLALAVRDHGHLDKDTFNAFAWQARFIDNDFSLFAYKALLDAARPENHQDDNAQETANEAVAAANGGSFERCMERMMALGPSTVGPPLPRVLDQMMREDTGVDNETIARIMLMPADGKSQHQIGDQVFLRAFARSAKENDYGPARDLWKAKVRLLVSQLPDGALSDALHCASGAGDVPMAKDLARELARRLPDKTSYSDISLLSADVGRSLLTAAVRDSTTVAEIADKAAAVLAMWPDTRASRVPAVASQLASLGSVGNPAAQAEMIMAECGKLYDTTRLFMANAFLHALASHNWHTAVFYAYRRFINEGFVAKPDYDTLRTLIEAAFRLRNSKKLSYTIYSELVDKYGVKPTPAIFERIFMIHLTGASFDSALYFLSQARLHNVRLFPGTLSYIRHTARGSYKVIASLDDPAFPGREPPAFVSDTTLEKGASGGLGRRSYSAKRDKANTKSFIEGWVLDSSHAAA